MELEPVVIVSLGLEATCVMVGQNIHTIAWAVVGTQSSKIVQQPEQAGVTALDIAIFKEFDINRILLLCALWCVKKEMGKDARNPFGCF